MLESGECIAGGWRLPCCRLYLSWLLSYLLVWRCWVISRISASWTLHQWVNWRTLKDGLLLSTWWISDWSNRGWSRLRGKAWSLYFGLRDRGLLLNSWRLGFSCCCRLIVVSIVWCRNTLDLFEAHVVFISWCRLLLRCGILFDGLLSLFRSGVFSSPLSLLMSVHRWGMGNTVVNLFFLLKLLLQLSFLSLFFIILVWLRCVSYSSHPFSHDGIVHHSRLWGCL